MCRNCVPATCQYCGRSRQPEHMVVFWMPPTDIVDECQFCSPSPYDHSRVIV